MEQIVRGVTPYHYTEQAERTETITHANFQGRTNCIQPINK